MNNLSWFLYIADVLPSLGTLSATAAFFALVFGGFIHGALMIHAWENDIDWPGKRVVWHIILVLVLAVLSILIPSKETLYKIAASEVGETIVKNPSVQKEALEIYEQLKSLLKPKAGQ